MTTHFVLTDQIQAVTGLADGTTYFFRVNSTGTVCIVGANAAPTDKQTPSFTYPSGGSFSFRKIAGEEMYAWVLEDNGSGTLVYDVRA